MDTLRRKWKSIHNFASTDKNKEIWKKYTKRSDEIKNLIEKINNKPGEYEKVRDCMRIV